MRLEALPDGFVRLKFPPRFQRPAGIVAFNEDERRNIIGQDSVAGKRDWIRHIIAFKNAEIPVIVVEYGGPLKP